MWSVSCVLKAARCLQLYLCELCSHTVCSVAPGDASISTLVPPLKACDWLLGASLSLWLAGLTVLSSPGILSWLHYRIRFKLQSSNITGAHSSCNFSDNIDRQCSQSGTSASLKEALSFRPILLLQGAKTNDFCNVFRRRQGQGDFKGLQTVSFITVVTEVLWMFCEGSWQQSLLVCPVNLYITSFVIGKMVVLFCSCAQRYRKLSSCGKPVSFYIHHLSFDNDNLMSHVCFSLT